MQKPFKFFFSLLCLPVLFGCQNVDIATNTGDKFQLMMTLEHNSYFKADYTSFSGIGSSTKAEDIISRVDHGEDVLFAYTKEDCSSCESFLKNAGRYLYNTNYRFSYIKEDTKAAAETINNYVITNGIERVFSHPMSGGTPSLYVMSKKRIVELAYGSNNNDEKIVSTAFKEYLTGTNIMYSGLYKWLMLHKINGNASTFGITYVLSKEKERDFYNNVYPLVLKSGKPFRVLNIGSYPKESKEMEELYGFAGKEDIEGKLFDVHNASTTPGEYEKVITVIDDVQSYLNENYVSSSL